eukprot:scaffold7.g3642.t1
MTVDAKALVASLAAAKDVEALEAAIAEASPLDATPGDDRQKLRAARIRLKKMKAEAAAKAAAAAAANNPSERSPHAKEASGGRGWARQGGAASYDAGEFAALVEKYEKLNWRIISKPGGATVKPDDFYTLYGYHMQATQGDNTGERPMWAEKGGLDFEGRARWDAWTAVKGVSTDKAKLEFVRTYYEFLPKALYSDTR